MKAFTNLKSSIAAALVLSTALFVTFGTGNASAIACYPYVAGNTQTSSTPVFNNICGVPSLLSSSEGQYPIGDEPDFVRIRPNVSGDDTNSAANPKLRNQVDATCNTGDKFDVWTYIHNDASQDDNNNGTGSAVAKNARLALSAPTNTQNSSFSFSSRVSADNAASVSDSAVLNCGGKQVKLTLVGGSVHYNNNLNQTTYHPLSDSSVNGTTALGSPIWGNGNVWGCWDYRMVVVYQVTVTEIQTPPPVVATCDMFSIVANEDRKVRVTDFKYTNKNVGVTNVVINWGDNNKTTVGPSEVIGQTHQYPNENTDVSYTISAVVNFANNTSNGGAGTPCVQTVKFSKTKPPIITPGPTTPTPPAPTSLVNTGPGSIAGIFAAVTAAGTVAYRKLLTRRLSDV